MTHVFSEQHVQYAVFLRCHLSSIVQYSGKVDTKVTICYTESDSAVIEILDEFQNLMGKSLAHIRLTPGELFRRAIGRNRAALATDANLVWFADCDMIFGEGCLSRLETVWQGYQTIQPPVMVWPSEVQIHASHAIGDTFWQVNVKSRGLLIPDFSEFVAKPYHKAIGGTQIVFGDYCRKNGYLNGFGRWLKPTDGESPFPSFADDVKFRRHCTTQGRLDQIDLPGIYRLRHSSVTYKGK